MIAAGLYIGIKRDWENLPESDRKATLAYLQDQGLPIRLFKQFLGVTQKDAEDFAWRQLSDATSAKTSEMIGLQGRAITIMSMGRSMVNPGQMLEWPLAGNSKAIATLYILALIRNPPPRAVESVRTRRRLLNVILSK